MLDANSGRFVQGLLSCRIEPGRLDRTARGRTGGPKGGGLKGSGANSERAQGGREPIPLAPAPLRGPMPRSGALGRSARESGPILGSRIAGESFVAHRCRTDRNRSSFLFRDRDRTRNRPMGQSTKPDLTVRPALPLFLHRQPAPKNAKLGADLRPGGSRGNGHACARALEFPPSDPAAYAGAPLGGRPCRTKPSDQSPVGSPR